MTTLNDALTRIAAQLGVDAQQLIDYANEDTVGGYHEQESERKWPCGSLWEVEGKVLYAATRALRPAKVLEIGAYKGCSSTHILSALEANGKGKLISLDLLEGSGVDIPETLRQRWQFVATEAAEYIRTHTIRPDIVYEDALHDPEGTRSILSAVRDCTTPRIIISHDAEHYVVGGDVKAAWTDVFGEFDTALIEPSDCGLAWKVQDAN